MNDLRQAAESLQRVLEFVERTQNDVVLPTSPMAALQKRVVELENQLQEARDEKDYWFRKSSGICDDFHNSLRRPRTNSELRVIADTISRGSEESLSDLDKEDGPPNWEKRAPFRLLQCSDEECEVFTAEQRNIRTQHRAKNNVQMMWDTPPKTVLIVKKPNDDFVSDTMISIAQWLLKEKNFRVYLEPVVHATHAKELPGTLTWTSSYDWIVKQNEIDFVVSLGGDGTVLWVSSLFHLSVPPVISFAMGSLGFLTPFDISTREENLSQIIRGGIYLSLRQRLQCTVLRAKPGVTETIAMPIHALNEVVIDRGPSSAIVDLDCYCDGVELTKISADGVIIASPTGSTAYSLSAGGSMTHPSVPCMLLTPICPHSLSFRPLLFHDSATLKIVLPFTARTSNVNVSFDGKSKLLLNKGDALYVRVSSYPLPSVCRLNENEDWFESVKSNLNWNQRREQKPWAGPGDTK
ncbi:NAD kinase [Thraustotheca clavata]|uniref:NAD kinase n=1 Tax=Thraustotheca clavata TaxID=74557 RepID=A0A1W0A246_9STRA|nr:NAD kinase [Thraustotheca clavata]